MKKNLPSAETSLREGMIVTNRKMVVIYNPHTHTICLRDLINQQPDSMVRLDEKDNVIYKKMMISNKSHLLVTWVVINDIDIDSSDEIISIYDLKSSPNGTKTLVCTQKIKKAIDEYVKGVEIIPHTNLIAILYNEEGKRDRVKIFNSKTNKCIRSFNVPRSNVMEFFANEIMITASDYRINLWDLKEKSETPTHSIKTKNMVRQLIKISDKQCIVHEKEGFIKIYDLDSLKYMDSADLKKSFSHDFYNLDNKHFISVHCSTPYDLTLNLWALDDHNHFKRLPTQDFPINLTFKHHIINHSISFIPVETDEGNWLCVIQDNCIKPMKIPTNNDFTSNLGIK